MLLKLIGLLCVAGSVYSVCMNGWIRDDNSCYLFEDLQTETWDKAVHYCQALDGHLVWVDSLQEHNFIKAQLAKLHADAELQFWTAGNDRNTEGTWVWGNSTDGFEVTYWHVGEPNQNGGEEDCLTYYPRYHFDWNDEHCDRSLAFICEMEDPVGPGNGNNIVG